MGLEKNWNSAIAHDSEEDNCSGKSQASMVETRFPSHARLAVPMNTHIETSLGR